MHHDPTSASASFSTSSSQSPVSSSPSAASLASATTSLSSTSSSTSAATTSHSLSRVTVSVSTSASPALAPPSHPHNPSSAPVRHHPRRGTAGASTASVPCLTSSHIRPNVNRNADVLAIHQSFDLSKPYTPPSPSPPQAPSLPKSTALSSTHNKQSPSSPTGGSHSDRSVSLSQQLVSASVQEQYVSLKSQQTSQLERHPQSGSPASMSRREKFDNSIVNNNNNKNKNKTNINHNNNNNSSISRNGLGIQTIDQQGDAIVMDHVLDQDSFLPSTQAADTQVSNSGREEHGRCKRRKSSSSRSSRHQILSNDGSSSTRSRSKRSRSSKRRDKHRISNGGDGGDEREREGWQSSSRRSVARIHITEECCVEQGNCFSSYLIQARRLECLNIQYGQRQTDRQVVMVQEWKKGGMIESKYSKEYKSRRGEKRRR
ncbi:MAG: hypothetical protein J3R72DRAFT_441100 [Linnemannia gamsii]|nr:MAG: hypothetical protein J3R72DRAFT_441100 [Linnemannia gamsii]